MVERLTTPVAQEQADSGIDTETPTTDPEANKASQDHLAEARRRVQELIDLLDAPAATAETEKADEEHHDTTDDTPTVELPRVDDNEPTETAQYDFEPEPEDAPRSLFRKIGDYVLDKQQAFGKGLIASKLEEWSIIPVRGTWHQQRGWNFSAWVARRYVQAQERRNQRLGRNHPPRS